MDSFILPLSHFSASQEQMAWDLVFLHEESHFSLEMVFHLAFFLVFSFQRFSFLELLERLVPLIFFRSIRVLYFY